MSGENRAVALTAAQAAMDNGSALKLLLAGGQVYPAAEAYTLPTACATAFTWDIIFSNPSNVRA